MPQIPESVAPLVPLATSLVIALATFIAAWVVSRWAESATRSQITRRTKDPTLGGFFAGLAKWTVFGAGVIAALGAVGIETTSIVAVFASAGLAVGLALQGSLANFASGVMLLIFRPFKVDDAVTAGGETGRVEEIGLFATTLVTPDNLKKVVPNTAITGGNITNITTLGTRRGAVEVGVAYGSRVEEVIPVLEKAARSADLVLAEPPVAVAFTGLGASSLDFTVLAWSKSADYLGMMHNVRVAVYNALNEAGIEIPFAQIVVHKAPGA